MMTERRQKAFAFIAALVFGIVILGSLASMAAVSDHHCDGDSCRVCEIIQKSVKLLGSAGSPAAPRIAFAAPVFIAAVLYVCGRTTGCSGTLISLKVELLD